MSRHNVTITTGADQNEHRVEIDGHNIAPGLRSMTVNLGPGGRRPRIEMELSASMIDVVNLASPDTEVMLSLPDGAREALIAFGWTPPATVKIENYTAGSPEDVAASLRFGVGHAKNQGQA